jgi:hypothetical protein
MATNAPPTPARWSPGRVVLVVGLGSLVLVAALITVGGKSWGNSTDQTTQILKSGLRQVMKETGTANVAAASAASAAEARAARYGVPLQDLSTAFLNARLPAVVWVDAKTNTPYTPKGKRIVGISVQDGHDVTAVQPFQGQCNFGLVVVSPSDPIIVTDHLGGAGTFGSNVGSTTAHCGVASAPSSWLPVEPQALSSLADLPRSSSECRSSRSGNSVSETCPLTLWRGNHASR